MLIYLDMCCFNRPFVDQTQLLVHLQTQAKLFVQENIRAGEFNLAWSSILDLENSANPDVERSKAIAEWRFFATHDVAITEQVEELADTLQTVGIKSMDALHLACAITIGADYFLTTDKAILRKMVKDERIQVRDPVEFLGEYTGADDENGY